MADPVALQILKALKTRLDTISVANGYNYDPSVVLGLQQINDDQMSAPIIHIYETDDDATGDARLYEAQVIDLRVEVQAHMRLGALVKADALAYLWQDIMRAVFDVTDTTLGGLALTVLRGPKQYVYPQPGGETVAVNQRVDVRYLETYGEP